jgi:hypothetical protein
MDIEELRRRRGEAEQAINSIMDSFCKDTGIYEGQVKLTWDRITVQVEGGPEHKTRTKSALIVCMI